MAKKVTADPKEGEVYVTPERDHVPAQMRRIIGVHTGAAMRTRKGERVSVIQTWVTYNDGGNTNSRCQAKAFRRWIRTHEAAIQHATAT